MEFYTLLPKQLIMYLFYLFIFFFFGITCSVVYQALYSRTVTSCLKYSVHVTWLCTV